MFNIIKKFQNYIIINARLIIKEVYNFNFNNLFKVLKKILDLLKNFNFIAFDFTKVIILYYIY